MQHVSIVVPRTLLSMRTVSSEMGYESGVWVLRWINESVVFDGTCAYRWL